MNANATPVLRWEANEAVFRPFVVGANDTKLTPHPREGRGVVRAGHVELAYEIKIKSIGSHTLPRIGDPDSKTTIPLTIGNPEHREPAVRL